MPELEEQLSGLNQLVQRSPVPQNFPSQFGAVLGGVSAGIDQTNPALDLFQSRRNQDIAHRLNAIKTGIELRRFRETQDTALSSFLSSLLESPSQPVRDFAAKGFAQLFQRKGLQFPPEVIQGLATKIISKDNLNSALVLAATPGIDPRVIEEAYPDIKSIGGISALKQIAQSDAGRKLLKLPTNEELSERVHKLQADEKRAAARELTAQTQAKSATERLALEKEKVRLHAEDIKLRREEKFADPATGRWVNRITGEVGTVTKGELRAEPYKFKPVTTQEEVQLDNVRPTGPIFDRLQELIPRLLQNQPAKNLVRALELNIQGKAAASEDLREFQNLVEESNIKMTNVLGSGGQFRIRLLEVLRAQVGAKTSDTIATAMRTIQTSRTSMENLKRSIAGQPLIKFGTVVGPGTWRVKNRTTNQTQQVYLTPGESLPEPWEAIQYVSPNKPGR